MGSDSAAVLLSTGRVSASADFLETKIGAIDPDIQHFFFPYRMVSGGWHHADPDFSSSSDTCQLPCTFTSTSLLISTTTSTSIKQPGGDSFLPLSMVGRHQAGSVAQHLPSVCFP